MAHVFLKFSLFLTTLIVFFEFTTTAGQCKDEGLRMLGIRIPCKDIITRGASGKKRCLTDKRTRCCQTCRKLGYVTGQAQKVTLKPTMPTRRTPRPTPRPTHRIPQTTVQKPKTMHIYSDGKCKDEGLRMLGIRVPCKDLITRGAAGKKRCLTDKRTRCCQTCRKLGYVTGQEQKVTSKSAVPTRRTVPTRKTPRPPDRTPETKTQTSRTSQTPVQKPRTLHVQSEGACSENHCKNEGLCFLENGAPKKCACANYTRGSNCEEKMDTCSPSCSEVGECMYYLEDTALCVCHVPARHFCRVTSAVPTTNGGIDVAESTVKYALIAVSVAIVLVMIICCAQFFRAKSKTREAREAFKASLERGAVPDDIPPNFMAFFCCRGNNAGIEEHNTQQIRRKKSSSSHHKDDTHDEQSEAKKKKKKKKKDKKSKKFKSDRQKERETENQSANSSRRPRAYYFDEDDDYYFDEDDDTNAFSLNGYNMYNRNVTQRFTKHSQRTDQDRYTTKRPPRHYKYTSTTVQNTKTTDGGLRERMPFLRRPPGCMNNRKTNNHKTDKFNSYNTNTESYESG